MFTVQYLVEKEMKDTFMHMERGVRKRGGKMKREKTKCKKKKKGNKLIKIKSTKLSFIVLFIKIIFYQKYIFLKIWVFSSSTQKLV